MIVGMGADLANVSRFEPWLGYSHDQLLRIFSPEEIAVCFADIAPTTQRQRLASRFAAKEAFFKALNSCLNNYHFTSKQISLLWCCKIVFVRGGGDSMPLLVVDWNAVEKKINAVLPEHRVHLSLTHDAAYALAYVIIESC